MRSPRCWGLSGVWLVALAGLAALLQAPAPLFVNLGPGDAPFIHGFRGDWERDGALQDGATTFRWALDGSRLRAPVEVTSGRLEVRLRLARFAETPAEVRLRVGDRVVARWLQHPRGWTERVVQLGEVRGPLEIQFRAEGTDAEGLALALDWAEIRGVGRVRPAGRLVAGMLALLVGVPLLVGLVAGSVEAAAAAGSTLAVAGAVGVHLDRLGGLVALGAAGAPALLAAAAIVLLQRWLRRAWPSLFPERAVLVPLAATTLSLLALSHPFFYYPDVDTHAEFLAALRTDPTLAWDPSPFQEKVGAWTRQIGDRRIAFPYSPAFHLAAWPFALVLGEVPAVKWVATVMVGLTLLLTFALARLLGLGARSGVLAQALLALFPVISSRLTLALYPALLGQAAELALVLVLIRHIAGAASSSAVFAALLLTQAAYTGTLLSVSLLVPALAALGALADGGRAAARLLAAWLASLALVVLVLYSRFLPVLLADVLPLMLTTPAGTSSEAAPAGWRSALRAWHFYGAAIPALAALGLWRLRAAPRAARRVLLATLACGAGLLALRGVTPALVRDAKEIELLAAPLAVLAAAGLAWLGEHGRRRRIVAVAAAGGVLAWGAWRAAGAYLERFVAVGR
jgi:hypothetical protein